MPSESIFAALPLQETALRLRAQRGLRQLEQSLERSQKALLARDRAGLEQETAEQRALAGELAEVLPRCSQSGQVHAGEALGGMESKPEQDLVAEIRLRQKRVWMEARVQAALLRKAQTRVRMLERLLAGPSANYGPLLRACRSTSHMGKERRV